MKFLFRNINLKIHSYKTIIIISLLFFSCITKSDGCGDGNTEINDKCYNENDIAVLQAFIENTSVSIPEYWDVDSNGSIDPLEYGIQEWDESGRLTLFDIYDYKIMGNTIRGKIPENIGDLTQLKKMNLAVHEISGDIPESIGNLGSLNFLYLYHNQLSGKIPESICNIFTNLDNFWIQFNLLCPPYPACIPEDDIVPQNTFQCLEQ